MKSWMKKLLCVSLGVCLLLSGCAGSKKPADETPGPDDQTNADAPMGRYVEQICELPPGDTVPLITVQKDGSLLLYNLAGGQVVSYTSADGQNWEESNDGLVSSLMTYLESQQGLMDFADISYGPEGEAYVLYRDQEAPHLIKSTDGKMFEEIVMDGWGQATFPMQINALAGGDFLIGYFDRIVRYGSDGSEMISFDGLGTSYAITADQITYLKMEGNGFLTSDIVSGETINEVPYTAGTAFDGNSFSFDTAVKNLMAADDSGAIYIVDKGGIHRLAPGGSLWETVVDGGLTSLGAPSNNICALRLDGSGGFYVAFNKDSAFSLAHYTYSADTASVPGDSISVYALRDNETVRQAIGEFQRMHPDYKVDFQYGLSGDAAPSVSDLTRTLNTELLGGKGPDILLLDGLPVESYIEKGVLLDMGSVLNPMIDSGEILPNVAAPYVRDGKVYAMPARIAVPVMIGSPQTVDSLNSLKILADAVEQGGDTRFLSGNTTMGRVAEFFLTCCPAWMNADGTIQEQALAEYLTDIKRIGDLVGDRDYVPEWAEWQSPSDALVHTDELGDCGASTISLFNYFKGDIKLHVEMFTNFGDLALPVAAKEENGGKIVPLCGQSAHIFSPRSIVGINSASPVRDMALDFVAILFGEAVQSVDLDDGFAVNANALVQGVGVQENTGIAIGIEDQMFSAPWPSEENLRLIVDMIKTLDTPSTVDPALLQMVQDGSEAFFAGEETAEQAASAIAERAQAYLTE